MPNSTTTRRCVMAMLAFTLVGCRYFTRKGTGSATPSSTPAPSSQPGGPSDANVAAIVLAANNTDISYARVALAPARTSTKAIKDFAQRMLTDHSAVNQLVSDVLTKIDLRPEDNDVSLDFRDESATKRDLMRELTGRAFDSTYIANEVSYHTRLLASIDYTLLPAARNQELRQLLTNIRPAVAAHLAHAHQVQTSIGAVPK
jgi:putative membrane protein